MCARHRGTTYGDDRSKAILLPNQEAASVAKAFVTRIIVEHGTPEKILTDQGTNFTSELLKNVCKLLKITKIQTTAYHPESNALTKPPKQTYSYDNYAQELRERLRAANQIAKGNAQQAKQQAKKQYDKSVKREIFEIEDKVLLYNEALRRGRSKKLESQWAGPYTILEKHNE
ncbi:PREDICTED: uncharacterized protein LOC105458634, partial [Wasmannia auropunctata]|uniref:uncharacterized protein LOC105458634 n=1 Tax=Wasmannia auropunctata TaxID=64793 RepID=UPI0005EFB23F